MEQRKKLPECPKCGTWMRARTSVHLDPSVRRIYRRCTRPGCGFTCTSLQWYEFALNQVQQGSTIPNDITSSCIEIAPEKWR
ncbi:ogr/Delta-like zinc finger family protein [Pectobacterium sp. A113-S21-F16]|nr:ogr/Delta-like zinc finger family protein [Pectobacterium quasiaquaticum]QRN37776.1 ogr/Delta-like zinc finger family protein [Pectobacterium carotovorum]